MSIKNPQAEDGDADSRWSRAEVMAWVTTFADYLSDTALPAPGATPHPAPSLAVSVVLPDNDEPVTIVGNAQSFTVQTGEKTDTAFCMLQLTDHQAISSLCASDVQGLLDSIVKGASVLHGQIEPFIWLIGRLSDWQREAPHNQARDVEPNAVASGGVV